METIKFNAHVGKDGILKLEVPTGITNKTLEVLVVLHALEESERDANGWPVGFFERTYGALADDPIDRPPQLPLEERDPIE